ncbi:Protein of unknown function (DUF2516) [Brevibacterium sp. Mu109]|uniref:DUF2516 family protein n=1 Tax=Brevibacterium sp. Mu109 TaxID=1255669 RepID=UPI000C473BB9|nr:DUF2516 family protein [Brevibacterium sp. Mu109]SMX96454.1 Protein of unknown function (DUF2516) [Brevibacterium sp. Mu109]
MQALASIQSTVFLVIIVAIFVFTVVGLVSSLLYSDEMYRAADKRTKKFWCLILGASALVGFLAVPPLSAMPMFVTIIALIAGGCQMVCVSDHRMKGHDGDRDEHERNP